MSNFNLRIALVMMAFLASSCFKDLDTVPIDPVEITSGVVFDQPEAYKQVLSKLYAGLAVSGQEGPAGNADIAGIDEGFGQYLRGFWYHQELTTDEAVIGWNDQTIQDFQKQTWTAADGFIYAFYSRIFYQITACNEFLRETTDARLDSRGVDGQLRQEIAEFRAEARFLRALSYWHALDLFRNVPFVTEDDVVGAFFPRQIGGNELFEYIESELLEIESTIAPPRGNEYARADRAALWMLLAKLYLNAEVYIGQNRYNEALKYAEQVIGTGYKLDEEYQHLFLADNDRSEEIIFTVAYDGINTRTWGGTTFIINAGIGGSMNPSDLGMGGGWGGTRATREFIAKFPEGEGGLVSSPNPGATATYRKLYVPGTHQGNDATDTQNALSDTNNDGIYEGYKFFPEPGMSFRLTNISSNSAPIYGDNNGDGNLTIGGAPIVLPDAGLHFFEVNWTAKTYSVVRQDWSIGGDAVIGGPVAMTWNADEQVLIADLEMNAGNFTFLSSDPDFNLGDANGDGILERGNAPITKITENGSYQIRLFLNQPDYTYQINSTSFDRRGIFHRPGQSLDIVDVTDFTNGIAVTKFKNIRSDGTPGSDATHADTDFPMFRLADAYLMAAEAILRDNGDKNQAATYVNTVRARAFKGSAGNITAAELDLDFILDERAREFYWECHRRTDLIRFNRFSESDYLWQWKGGVMDGASVPAYRNIFPIPTIDISLNPNLEQNPNY